MDSEKITYSLQYSLNGENEWHVDIPAGTDGLYASLALAKRRLEYLVDKYRHMTKEYKFRIICKTVKFETVEFREPVELK